MSTPAQTNVTTPESQVGMATGTAAGAGAGGEPGVMNQMGGRKRTDWMIHVKNVQRANKGLNLMKVLKLAAKTYKKKPSSKKSARKTRRGGGMVLQPAVAGGRRRRGTRKGTRRGGFDY